MRKLLGQSVSLHRPRRSRWQRRQLKILRKTLCLGRVLFSTNRQSQLAILLDRGAMLQLLARQHAPHWLMCLLLLMMWWAGRYGPQHQQ